MKQLLLIIVSFGLFSCDNELKFETKSFSAMSSPNYAEGCPRIDISLPIAKNRPIVADSINKKVLATMKEVISFGEKPFKSNDIQGIADDFMKAYDKVADDFPNDKIGWDADVTGKIAYHSERICNMVIDYYTYTGGAHGYSGKRSLIFNVESGKCISDKQVIKNEAEFLKIAEAAFRKKYKIASRADLNESGYMFETGKFQLPQTYVFTPKGLLLFYNIYEIASYAQGSQEVLIPYAEADPYIAIKY